MSDDFVIIDAPQRSPEWFAARLGRVTGSKAACVMMGEKTAGRADYMMQLALERLTGTADEFGYVSAEMQRGIDKEPLARMRAEADGWFIRETGFISHCTLMIGASLDGDTEEFKWIWEFKNPKSTTHVKYLRTAGALLVQEYQPQLMHNALTTGARFVVAGSFDDRMPIGLEWVRREVPVTDLPMAEYDKALRKFLAETADLTAELKAMQEARMPDAAPPQITTEEPMELTPQEAALQDTQPTHEETAAFSGAPPLVLNRIAQPATSTLTEAQLDAIVEGAMAQDAAEIAAAAPDTAPSLSLGKIGARLGFAVTADFLLSLGFAPAATVKASKLFHERDFGAICAAIIRHISTVAGAD